MYTREIEESLLKDEVDLAVHRAKDMALILPEGLRIGAVLQREDSRDCLVSKNKKTLSELPSGTRVGASSLRRKMQLLKWNPEVIVEEVHGNVESRIRKLEAGNYDAVVLAYAGMKRLGLENYVAEVFPEEKFYPAPGQGTIVVELRESDTEVMEILGPMDHKPSALRLECERACLRYLQRGCWLPCGIMTKIESGILKVAGAIFSIQGGPWAEARLEASMDQPSRAGEELAKMLLENGGKEILERIRCESARKK